MAGDIDDRRQEIHEAVRLAREAKAATDRLAADMATFRHSQAEQGAQLLALTGAQTQMLVSMAEIKTDLGWIRNDLVKQVGDARDRAEDAAGAAKEAADKAADAKSQAKDAPSAKRGADTAQILSIVAMLIALIAGILGVQGITPLG